ncbi:hypothetical protein HanIR_Chr16g0832001 [Helianthus annuus]|nr:hypothetical protein HanIR_Chr16g0832001 [Helianthus annuus]
MKRLQRLHGRSRSLGLVVVYELFVEYGDEVSGLLMIWRVFIGVLCGVLLMKLFLVFIVAQTERRPWCIRSLVRRFRLVELRLKWCELYVKWYIMHILLYFSGGK